MVLAPRLPARSIVIGAVSVCSVVLLLATPAGAQPVFEIDHFKCYITTDEPVSAPIQLRDQFDGNTPENITVWRPVRFCNPVEKTRLDTGAVTRILNPKNHLKFYRIFVDDPDLAPVRTVVVANQFGKRTIQTFDQIAVAVPTEKNDEGPPSELDHFKCYRADGGGVKKAVDLSDQFGKQEAAIVGKPFLFCNPAEKVHDGKVTPITNAADHLVCYKITRAPFARTVTTRNQFGEETLALRDSDLLCVPSKKRTVTVLQ